MKHYLNRLLESRGWHFMSYCLLVVLLAGCSRGQAPKVYSKTVLTEVALPQPRLSSSISLEEALQKRRSLREYSPRPPELAEVSQLLWAAQGITGRDYPFRTAPSAGATYPLETWLVVGTITGLEPGIYHYKIASHSLELAKRGDFREALSNASVFQQHVKLAPATIVLTAVYERTTERYGTRGGKYVYMEAGHVGQNICLQAEALGLGTVPVGAVDEQAVAEILGISGSNQVPVYIFPFGRKP